MQETIQYIKEELKDLYPESEIYGFTRLIIENVCGLSYTEMILWSGTKLSSNDRERIHEIVKRLKTCEPIQYILSETEFCDLKLKLNPSVLIPRPETEELTEWIKDSISLRSPAVLDIGTGSGCIALALKKQIRNAVVSAVDISENALQTARSNAEINNLDVNFFCVDILRWQDYKWDVYDLIVSNPPYVLEKEKRDIPDNVLKFEPHEALFVPDLDPLKYYRAIAECAEHYLKEKGSIYVEINEKFGKETVELFQQHGFSDVEIKKDINGKERMLRCLISSGFR